MPKASGEAADQLESALLYLGRSPQELGVGLVLLLGSEQVTSLAKNAGRRRAGKVDFAMILADAVLSSEKVRNAVVKALLDSLPEPLLLPELMLDKEHHEHLSRAAKLAVLAQELGSSDEESWESARLHIVAWAAMLLAPEMLEDDSTTASLGADPNLNNHPGASSSQQRASKISKLNSRIKKLERDKDGLKARFDESKREVSRLQKEVGIAHTRYQGAREEWTEAKTAASEERRRATEFKRKLNESSSPANRELALSEELEQLAKRLHISEQKFEMVETEREDLRACLEDHDRFNKMPDEELPSFRNRPLISEEQELANLLAAEDKPPARVLVVGGGEPQYRHLDKFSEYAAVLGFEGSWRMAEYDSWHKEMDRLAKDMESNFDGLVILHWNRTTFTRKAREICNIKGQKPCITCHYEGFVSLRQSLGICLRQILNRPAR